MLTLTQFDRTTVITPDRDHPSSYTATLDPSWASLRGAHGGYVTSLAVKAAEAAAPDRSVRTVTASFLRPAQLGPVRLVVDVLRNSRSFTTVSVAISQDDRLVATTRITAIAPVTGHDWTTPVHHRPAPIDVAAPFTPPPGILHFNQATLVLDPDTVPRSDGSAPLVAGYVRPNERRPIDPAWLTMIGDWFPPSPFRRFEPPIGGVSIDYTIHIHRTIELDSDEWLEGVFHTPNSVDGIALEHGTLSTTDGVPVAETFHTRWTG